MLANDFPPWEAAYQQTQWWLGSACFEVMVHDLRALLHLASGRLPDPTTTVMDSRISCSTQRVVIGSATTASSARKTRSCTRP
jgi:hypothetical protein